MNIEVSELTALQDRPVSEIINFCVENNMEAVIEDGAITKFIKKE